jgi:OOP family OmpA-OmpF porin
MFVADEETWIPGEEAKLDRISATMAGLKKAALSVTGHTADDNKPNAQLALSIARAEAVKAYLLQHQGNTTLTITATGKGATEPKVTGVSVGDQGPNRRVEIAVTGAE